MSTVYMSGSQLLEGMNTELGILKKENKNVGFRGKNLINYCTLSKYILF